MDEEWDESYPEQRISSEFTYEILEVLMHRGVSKETALAAAREVLAKGCGNDSKATFDLDRWIKRVQKR